MQSAPCGFFSEGSHLLLKAVPQCGSARVCKLSIFALFKYLAGGYVGGDYAVHILFGFLFKA